MRPAAVRPDGVQGVAEEVDEDLQQAIRVADHAMLGARVVQELHMRRLFVDGDQRPGFFDQRPQRGRLHLSFAHAREVDQAFADAAQTVGDALHAR